jgi:uncharacterized membrane protein YjjP (DUF1212 family)
MDATAEHLPDDREFFATAELLVSLAKALHHAGFASPVIEDRIQRAAAVLGARLEMLSLPTGMLLTVYRGREPLTYAIRERPGTVNLERMKLLIKTADALIAQTLEPAAAKTRIDEIIRLPVRWGSAATVAGYVASGGAFAVFFGGGTKEVLVAVIVGLAAGIFAIFLGRGRANPRIFELAAATSATAIAGLADRAFGSFVEWIPVAAGLIILLPGISLIDAVSELSLGHLVSGASRLAGVGVVFLALTFGAVVGSAVAELAPHASDKIESQPPAEWWVFPALAVVSLGSMIRFHARWSDLSAIFAASVVALFAAKFGTAVLGNYIGPFVGALLLGLAASVFSRIRNWTPEIVIIPGLALLVPGSIGVRSLSLLLSEDTAVAIQAAFLMFLIAMELVAGLLFSQALLPERRDAGVGAN